MTDWTFVAFTPDAKKLFGQAIDWAANGCCAQSSSYGKGVAGKNGIPTLTLDNLPKWGTTVKLAGSNSSGAATAAVLAISKTETAIPILGGTLLVGLGGALILPLPLPATGFSTSWALPDHSALCGRVPRSFHNWFFQLIQLDSAAAQGWSFTRGLRVELGK